MCLAFTRHNHHESNCKRCIFWNKAVHGFCAYWSQKEHWRSESRWGLGEESTGKAVVKTLRSSSVTPHRMERDLVKNRHTNTLRNFGLCNHLLTYCPRLTNYNLWILLWLWCAPYGSLSHKPTTGLNDKRPSSFWRRRRLFNIHWLSNKHKTWSTSWNLLSQIEQRCFVSNKHNLYLPSKIQPSYSHCSNQLVVNTQPL